MLRRVSSSSEFKVTMGDVEPGGPYSSSSTSSSSESNTDATDGGRRFMFPARRPGLRRLDLQEMVELCEMRRAAQRTAAMMTQGDGATNAAAPVVAPVPPAPKPKKQFTTAQETNNYSVMPSDEFNTSALSKATTRRQRNLAPLPVGFPAELRGVERPTIDAVVQQVGWNINPKHKVVLLVIAVFCTTAFLIYLGAALWMRVLRSNIFRSGSETLHADHADLPFLSGCDKWACHKYMSLIETSVNRSQDPCKNFYRFVCDGWKANHRLLSVLDVADDVAYANAINTVTQNDADPTTSSLGKRVVAFAKSCIDLSKSGLDDLKRFMADHHLPWPQASTCDLLEILLDLSGNWNLHLWFQVTFDLAPFRAETGEPVLKIGNSADFRAWIASMRTFVGQPRSSAASLRYRRYIQDMLHLFDTPGSRADELVSTIEGMDRLTLEVLGPAITDPEQKVFTTSIQNLTHRMTTGVPYSQLLLNLNEQFIWVRRFTADDLVEIENAGLLRAVFYLLGQKTETREALTLSLGLRVISEIGWMADREIADATLELMGLPLSAHSARCLAQVEESVGVAWLSLFRRQQNTDILLRELRDAIIDVVMRHRNTLLELNAWGSTAVWNDESYLSSMLPEKAPGTSFFTGWTDLTSTRLRLQEHHLTNVLKPGSAMSHRWTIDGIVTVSTEYFMFPLYHSDLPAAVNYAGAGRLIADEILRALYYRQLHQEKLPGHNYHIRYPNGSARAEWPLEWSPHHVDIKAVLAALTAYRLGIARHSSGTDSKDLSVAHDRLFFIASCYALCSSGDFVDEIYGDASRRCNVPVKAIAEFRAAFRCQMPQP